MAHKRPVRLRCGGGHRGLPKLWVVAALAVTAALIVTLPPALTARASAAPRGYTNPLQPLSAEGAVFDSCPDPTLLRGRGRHAGRWFMYCTNASVPDSAGGREVVSMPMLVSRDLVHWRSKGPAISPPTWAAPGARLWAPDIVYSKAHRRYYLSYAVTDTADEVSGVPGCRRDSSIGVATSAGPLGPWRHAAGPVVPPRRTGPGCSFATTIDPDVLGDVVGTRGVLFFGGFRGGIEAQRIRLFRHRMTLTGERRGITTDRYEAVNVVVRGRYYYLFASAGMCCESSLSGYGVFVGRATRPLGPYTDREGNRLLAKRTGGTPVIASSGNRWLGPGHSSVFRDVAGRWWTVYHAIDLFEPAFPNRPGSTRRPAMLDPVDWARGWPSVRSGRGASASPIPGPAAQRGQQSAYRPDWLPNDKPGAVIPGASDDFDAKTLASRWTWVREPDPTAYHLVDGGLRVETSAHNLSGSTRAPVLTTPAPTGDYVVETTVRLGVSSGSVPHHLRAGLVVYADDERYISLFHGTPGGVQTTAFGKHVVAEDSGLPTRGSMSVGPPGDLTRLRLVRRVSDGHQVFTAYTKQDGHGWVRGGTWRHDSLGASPRIGLAAFGGAGYTASFHYLRTWGLG